MSKHRRKPKHRQLKYSSPPQVGATGAVNKNSSKTPAKETKKAVPLSSLTVIKGDLMRVGMLAALCLGILVGLKLLFLNTGLDELIYSRIKL